MTSCVSILADPFFIRAAAGSAHLGGGQTNQTGGSCEPFVWALLPSYSTYLDSVAQATGMDEFCRSLMCGSGVAPVSLLLP